MTTDRVSPLPPVWLLVAVQAVVSAASLVVEIVAGRMLAPYVGMSLYTWTSVIAVVLAGFSAGHWAGGRVAEAQAPRALAWTGWALLGAALTTAAAVFALRLGAEIILPRTESAVTAIVGLSLLAFFLPSFFAGVPAPVLAQISVSSTPGRSGRALGAMFAAGAIGAIAGTLLAGFVFISYLGSIGTLVAVTACYLGSGALLFGLARRASLSMSLAVLSAAGLAAAALTQPNPCTQESDYFCIRSVDVSANPDSPVQMMVLDHLVHGMGARNLPEVMFTDHAALLDVLARARMGARPFGSFFIGGGTYSIPRYWATLAPRPEVTVAEIDPAVTRVAARDFWFDPATATILHEDARSALARREARYDVIIGDAFTDIAVPAHLITREFFELVARRLSDDGLYLMNVIDHADRLEALAALVATLETVFPVVEIWTEAQDPEPGARLVFVLAAGYSPSSIDRLRTNAPEPTVFGRLPDTVKASLLASRNPVILTDDFAPIDRLMGTSF